MKGNTDTTTTLLLLIFFLQNASVLNMLNSITLAAPAGKDFAKAMRTAQTCGLNMYNNIFYIPIANFHELVVY